MGRGHTGFRFMRKSDWGWLVAKLVSGVLLPITLIIGMDPKTGTTVRGILILSLLCLMVFGGLLCMVGIVLRGTRHRPLIVGYAMEVGGLTALVLGPVLLSFVYGVNSVMNGTVPTGSLLSLAIAAPYAARYIDIVSGHLAPKSGDATVHRTEPTKDG